MPKPNEFRLPRDDERLTILGTTGSGKTTLAAWVLSKSPFHERPYIAVDYKGDKLLGKIDRAREIGTHEKIPTHPGLYIVRPLPSDIDGVENWLWKLWHKEQTGLYIDEAYLLPNKNALKNLLAQGRSKRIPVIAASQRPVDVPRSLFTEASHITLFRLLDDRDYKTVSEFTPDGFTQRMKQGIPKHHSFWYNVNDHDPTDPVPYFHLEPVPHEDEIVDVINDRLRPTTKLL